MKNLLTKTVLAAALTATLASANSTENDSFLEYSLAQSSAQESAIFGIQPVSEIVGSDSTVHKIKYGINKEKARVFFLGTYAPDKNGEIGLGFGGEWHTKINENWGWFIGSEIVFAKQFVAGDTVNLSTNATKVSFVTQQNISSTPTVATYEEDNFNFQIGLTLGTKYKISKDLDLVGQYKYGMNNYQVAYRTAGNSNILNNMTFSQDTHEFSVGLSYKF